MAAAKNQFEIHVRVHHWEKPFPCNHCNKDLQGKKGFLIHTTTIHTRWKNYTHTDGVVRNFEINQTWLVVLASLFNTIFKRKVGNTHHFIWYTYKKTAHTVFHQTSYVEWRLYLCHKSITHYSDLMNNQTT